MQRLLICFVLSFLVVSRTPAFGQAEASPPTSDATPSIAADSGLSPAPITLSREQIQDLIRQVAEKDDENDKRQRDYTYVERVEEHKLNGKGEVTSTEVRTYDVMQIYREQCRRLTSKNDSRSRPEMPRRKMRKFRKSSTSGKAKARSSAKSA